MIERTRTAVVNAGLAAARKPPIDELLTRLEAGMRHDRSLAVLTYHRVDDPERRPWLYPGLVSATPAEFARQVAWLAARCAVVSMAEVLATPARRLPRRATLITFDDGYADLAEHAWPVLRDAGLPATLFLATGAAADRPRPFWWDRLYAAVKRSVETRIDTPVGLVDLAEAREDHAGFRSLLVRLKAVPHEAAIATVDLVEAAVPDTKEQAVSDRDTLQWPQLRRLEDEGLTIAPHTRTHPLLPQVAAEEARAEIERSRDELAAALSKPCLEAFAYPSGAYDDATVDIVRQTGVQLAFTTEPGLNGPRMDRLRLRRFNVGRRSSPGVLAARFVAARLAGRFGRARTAR